MKIGSLILLVIISILFISGCEPKSSIIEDDSMDKVSERNKLLIGISPFGAPMLTLNQETNEIAGFEKDLLDEISAGLGYDYEYKYYLWEDLFVAVQNEDVDLIISTITITHERSKVMLFSVPYFNAGQIISKKITEENLSSPEDLAHKKVGVLDGSTCEAAALDYTNSSNVYPYATIEEIIVNLKKGTVDAMVLDYAPTVNYVKINDDLELVGQPFTQEYYGLATNIDNIELMNNVNDHLKFMQKTGKLRDLEKKWLD